MTYLYDYMDDNGNAYVVVQEANNDNPTTLTMDEYIRRTTL